MAFPTNTSTALLAVNSLLSWAKTMRADATKYIAQCDASSLDIYAVAESFMNGHLSRAKNEIAILAAVDGIFDMLVLQKSAIFADATAAENAVIAVQTAINDMITFLEANLPIDVDRRVLDRIVSNDGTGTLTSRQITASGALATFRAQLVTFQSAFEA